MLDSTLFWTTLLILAAYTLHAGLLRFGLRRQRSVPGVPSAKLPVTVIVPARNESGCIPRLIRSLQQLRHSTAPNEFIIIDDDSTDDTYELASRLTRGDSRFRILRSTHSHPSLNGKAGALHEAIAQAKGELILVTDADCEVPAGWVEAHRAQYRPEIGMAGGFVLLTSRDGSAPLFARLQSLDWLYLCAVGGGAAGLGLPLSIFGNNFSFRKAAYRAVGGFPGAGFSVIEDFALMRAMLKKTRWRVALAPDPALCIQTAPSPSFRAFYAQRKRWVLGGRQVSATGLITLSVGFLGRIVPLYLLFFALPRLALAAFLWIHTMDFMLAATAATLLRRREQLRLFPLYPFFAIGYMMLFVPVFFLARTVHWKGRRYRPG